MRQNVYQMCLAQRRIIRDFYELSPEEQFGYRMVETPEKKKPTRRKPRPHLAGAVDLFQRRKDGRIKSMGVEHCGQLPQVWLLAEMDRIEQEMFDYLTNEGLKQSSGFCGEKALTCSFS